MSAHCLITDRSVSVLYSPRAPADRIGSRIKDQLLKTTTAAAAAAKER